VEGNALPDRKVRLFLSYSREETDWVESLVAALEHNHGDQIECRFDKRDLPFGEKWKHEIEEMIRWADAIIFVVSTNSVQSRWCQWEVSLVANHSKRLTPIQIQEIDKTLELRAAIVDVQIIRPSADLLSAPASNCMISAGLAMQSFFVLVLRLHSYLMVFFVLVSSIAVVQWSIDRRGRLPTHM